MNYTTGCPTIKVTFHNRPPLFFKCRFRQGYEIVYPKKWRGQLFMDVVRNEFFQYTPNRCYVIGYWKKLNRRWEL